MNRRIFIAISITILFICASVFVSVKWTEIQYLSTASTSTLSVNDPATIVSDKRLRFDKTGVVADGFDSSSAISYATYIGDDGSKLQERVRYNLRSESLGRSIFQKEVDRADEIIELTKNKAIFRRGDVYVLVLLSEPESDSTFLQITVEAPSLKHIQDFDIQKGLKA